MVGSGTIGSDVAVDLGLYRIMSNLKKILFILNCSKTKLEPMNGTSNK